MGKTGGQNRPLYDLNARLSKRDLAGFYRVHFAHTSRKGMVIARAAGAALFILGVVDAFAFGGTTSAALETGCGLGFFALSFWMGGVIGALASRAFSGPSEARYRFFENDFEALHERGSERHSYSDVKKILISRGVLYLFIGRKQAFVLTRDALAGRFGEVSAFLQRTAGRKAALIGRGQ